MATSVEDPPGTVEPIVQQDDYQGLQGPVPNIGWYQIDASCIGEDARKLLEDWSGIPPDKINGHVDEIRSKAFKVHPYPCIGVYRFLDLTLINNPHYPEILSRVRKGEKFLDLGCCFGQEVRRLAYDGAPSENLYGSDLRQSFIDLGYELFQDRNKLKSTFLAADAFDPNSPLRQLEGHISTIYTGSFFHLFDLDQQTELARLVVRLLKPEPGSLLLGRQVGNINPGVYARPGYQGEAKRFRHDPASWKEMWEPVGEETGTKWDVSAEMEEWGFGKGVFERGEAQLRERRREEGTKRLRFVVKRL